MKFLLIDDHAVVRKGFRRLLDEEFPGTEFGEASNGPEGVEAATNETWDLVVLDLSMPGRGGLDAIREIRDVKPGVPILVLTMHAEDQYAFRAFRAGASGYLHKAEEPPILFEAVKKLLAGGRYVSGALAEKLATDLSRGDTPKLSDREVQVLRLLATGKTVKQIGNELSLSEKTISTYRVRLLEKLGLSTTAELVRYALLNGYGD